MGFALGLAESPERSRIAALGERGGRGAAFGVYYALSGLGSLPGVLALGAVDALAGSSAALAARAALVAGLTALICALTARPHAEQRPEDAGRSRREGEAVNLGDAAAWYVAFVVSTTVHEAAHALVAYLGGDRTAYEGGQVSLNPIPHMQREPLGMIVMPLLSLFYSGWALGWASTPFDPRWAHRHPRRAACMSAAGPAANLLIAGLALGALRVGLQWGAFQEPEVFDFSFLVVADDPFTQNIGRFLSIVLVLNAILGVFNLIPVPPLDGSGALGLILPPERVERLKASLASGGLVSLLFVVVFLFFGQVVVPPIFREIVRLLYPQFAG
jgi:Zn-dependent protease